MKNLNPLVDSFGRKVDYLRISLTDICNFQCLYCEPPQGTIASPRAHHLSIKELCRFVEIISRLGVNRIRLTGGEPTLRPDLVEIVRALKSIPLINDVSITTNGSRLRPLLKPLKEAGLNRINISLDSLDPVRFEAITRRDHFEEVYQSVFDAIQMGFGVKLNMVILRGLRPDEIIQFVKLAYDYPLEVRFLEYMPLCGSGWKPELFLPIKDVRAIVEEHYLLNSLSREGQVAEIFSLLNGRGKVGFIASMTESFCNDCSRIRISVNGDIHPCLFSNTKVSVIRQLKENASDEAVVESIRLAVAIKPEGNQYIHQPYSVETDDYRTTTNNPLIKTIGG